MLSLYELEHFYCEVLKRLEEMNVESLSVENTVCQVLDMVNPKESGWYCETYVCVCVYLWLQFIRQD